MSPSDRSRRTGRGFDSCLGHQTGMRFRPSAIPPLQGEVSPSGRRRGSPPLHASPRTRETPSVSALGALPPSPEGKESDGLIGPRLVRSSPSLSYSSPSGECRPLGDGGGLHLSTHLHARERPLPSAPWGRCHLPLRGRNRGGSRLVFLPLAARRSPPSHSSPSGRRRGSPPLHASPRTRETPSVSAWGRCHLPLRGRNRGEHWTGDRSESLNSPNTT